MAFPPIEDWTPPWKDGEFDAEKAMKLIYNLSKDKSDQKERIAALRAEKSEIEDERDDLTDEVETLKAAKPAAKDGEQPTDVEAIVAAALAKAGVGPKSRKEQRKEAEQASAGDSLETARLRIALNKGLTEAQAKRLVGTNAEELEADADAYIEEHGLRGAEGGEQEQNGGTEGQAPPSQRARVTTGSRRQEKIDPLESLTPDQLYDKAFGGANA